MVWQPAAYLGNCSENSGSPLTLVCFILQYLGGSNDELLKDLYGDKNVKDDNYDFIIVGAGAAGCVVANRLSEESNWKVLLLEAGDEEPRVSEVPGLNEYLFYSSADYAYRTNDSKPETYVRGRVMGGSTTINGIAYVRGSKTDYDEWAKIGNEGWSWKDVLPYFKKSENSRDREVLSKYAEYHGTGGYLTLEQPPVEDKDTPLFIDAFKEVGFDEIDCNKGDDVGVYRKPLTRVHGTRLSTNGAFIRPIRGKRSNLAVRPNSRVTRIIIDPETKKAIGVEYETTNKNGTFTKKVYAKKEVIVSGGFIESPKLLMLSGIGPRDHLEQLNITVIKDLPVGLNLRDHFSASIQLTSNCTAVSETSDDVVKADVFEWMNTHEGPLSKMFVTNIQKGPLSKVFVPNIGALYQTKLGNRSETDIQYHVGPLPQADRTLCDFQIIAVLLKAKSKGFIRLNSIDPLNNQPDIRINPLSDPQDVEVLLEGLKLARKVVNTQTLKNAGFKLSTVLVPECQDFEIYSDDYLRCLIKIRVQNFSHGLGTCKMGPKTDENAVVDPTLKVRGVDGLRVIDASVMPHLVSGHTMAATIMIGEKGSDLIKKDHL